MKKFLRENVSKLPLISRYMAMKSRLESYKVVSKTLETELAAREAELKALKAKLDDIPPIFVKTSGRLTSIDEHPWKHPFLADSNIKRFRQYSEQVWDYAVDYQKKHPEPIKCAFVVNMAQNMHKWARLAQEYGAEVALFLNPMDKCAISCPEWEEFDGEHSDIFDVDGFLRNNPNIRLEVPVYRIPMNGDGFILAWEQFYKGERRPLLELISKAPGMRHEALVSHIGFYPYYQWAKALTEFDVLYATSLPLAAYASGVPYCTSPVGGDLIYDCGRGDDYGRVMSLSFNASRFMTFSCNAQNMGHARRLGFTNGLFLSYPMDSNRYYPGEGRSRELWESRYGKGVYVLMTSRLDKQIKGQDESFLNSLIKVSNSNPNLYFIFLNWGESAAEFQNAIDDAGMNHRFIVLSPVGKKRLIDYYRSCDIILDQLVLGYYGATALEAAAVGKPIVMYLRDEHYRAAYNGDVMPVMNVRTPSEVGQAILALAASKELRERKGSEMRNWLMRTHGEEKSVPLMLSLLRLTADRISLPDELLKMNPLLDPINEEEIAYHNSCLCEGE